MKDGAMKRFKDWNWEAKIGMGFLVLIIIRMWVENICVDVIRQGIKGGDF